MRLTSTIKRAIASIDDDESAWTPIEYTDAVYDEGTDTWISRAEVAEIPFTAFASQRKAHQIPGRLVVRRIPDLRPPKDQGQGTLFDIWRFHAFFTTTDPDDLDTVAADKPHRQHAVIEQVHADLKNSALAHLPVELVFGERRLAGLRGDGVQSHPRRRHPHGRPEVDESDHRHPPAHLVSVPRASRPRPDG